MSDYSHLMLRYKQKNDRNYYHRNQVEKQPIFSQKRIPTGFKIHEKQSFFQFFDNPVAKNEDNPIIPALWLIRLRN
jgi:hypothetical protein